MCTLKTDQAIRDALTDLPKNLSETFSRILRKSEEFGKSYQRRILQLTTAAYRPLTMSELREALSVIPEDAVWDPSRLLNDVFSALACCECLLIVDEEESTVRFVHHSVKQFLLRNCDASTDAAFTMDSARKIMADVVVTYLNYGVFGTELSTAKVPPIAIGSASSRIICSTLDSSTCAQSLALKLLESRKRPDLDISRILAEARQPFRSRGEHGFNFFSYAKLYWLQNIFYVSGEERVMYDLLLSLIEKRVWNANEINEVDWTPLEQIVHSWHNSIVRILLKSNEIDVNSKNSQGQTLLTRMVRKQNMMIVKLLLEMDDINVNSKDEHGMTSLSWAARIGNEAIIQLLLEIDDIDVNSKDQHQMTPLSWAARNGHEVVDLLLKVDEIDINWKDQDQITPLLWAARNENKQIVIMLLENAKTVIDPIAFRKIRSLCWTQIEHETINGSLFETHKFDVNWTDTRGRTPLILAIDCKDQAMIKFLLVNDKVDVNQLDNDQRTPLSIAVNNKDQALVRSLLNTGKVEVNSKDKHQRTPLFLAVKGKCQEIVSMLLQLEEVDVNSTNIDRQTPLYQAVQNGDEEIVKLLLEADKIDGNLKGNCGRTPLFLAVERRRWKIVSMLLQNEKIDVNSKVFYHRTPLLQAIWNGDVEVIELLSKGMTSKSTWRTCTERRRCFMPIKKGLRE